MSTPIRHKATYPFCKLSIYDDYIFITMNEGITVLPEYNDILIELAETFFKDRSFVYITYRINSYSVDPTIYLKTSNIRNLKGFVVVDPKDETTDTLAVEKLFFNKPFAAFDNIESAIDFKNSVLSEA
ncbi:hypothetical protein [Dokdonia sp. Hel_I_53]|uniref:hypothetical protein n=1 Tax=Dokdonia sp. Hel_I_53 TaxID=1566287 RepID=UPI00119B296F|nr:hypothetical protein [Dokdonia sp. Hel_I_53]TVZ51461.1 hypothetical protein OD90_0604 [Dokdonia sp. Hel_I_53]